MSEQQMKLPHALKEAELGRFRTGETAYVQPFALYADFNEDLWISSSATARGKSNSDYCVKVTTESRPNSLLQGDRLAKVDFSECSDDKKVTRIFDYRQYPPMPQMYSQNLPSPRLLPVVQIDGVDGKK